MVTKHFVTFAPLKEKTVVFQSLGSSAGQSPATLPIIYACDEIAFLLQWIHASCYICVIKKQKKLTTRAILLKCSTEVPKRLKQSAEKMRQINN